MAITFARLQPMHLTSRSGATRILAYTARSAIHDLRSSTVFDYSALSADLVHDEIILPETYPADFENLGHLAHALDQAEFSRVRTPLHQRERLPQVGLALVIALPPDDQISLRESIELKKRMVITARGSLRIPIHIAIHDPALLSAGNMNRHGHALFGLREFGPAGEAGPKVRDAIVRHRVSQSNTGTGKIVEGIDWPDLVWEMQQSFFAELGIDLVVDPIALYPGKHLSPVRYSNGAIHTEETKHEVQSAQADLRNLNVGFLKGSPSRLIDAMLRGRSSLRIAEIERICAKFIDHESDRQENVERILANQNVITFSETAAAAKPRYVTSRRTLRLLARAATIVDRADDGQVGAISGVDHQSVVDQISAECAELDLKGNTPLILGLSLSHCAEAAAALEDLKPVFGTIAMAITGTAALRSIGRTRDLRLSPKRLVIVPRAESVDDCELARVLIAANQCGARLMIGHDQSCKTGIVCRHLAVYTVDRLAMQVDKLPSIENPGEIERLLRCGLVRPAIEAMAKSEMLRFTADRNENLGDSSLFVVCDDARRIAGVGQAVREGRIASGMYGAPVRLERLRDFIELSVGEWIVTTQSNYAEPRLVSGRFARIVEIDSVRNAIEIELAEGDTRWIDPKKYPGIRTAAAISIREARGIFPRASLSIQLTDARRAWSTSLLAATHGANAQLFVDPKIAQTSKEFVRVVQRSLPGILPHKRIPLRDRDAEDATLLSSIKQDRQELELIPEPLPPKKQAPPPLNISERVRHLLQSNYNIRLGYQILYRHIGPDNADRLANTARILDLCYNDLTRAIVEFLGDIELGSTQKTKDELDDTFDLPPEIATHAPREWSEIEIYNLRVDLGSMSFSQSEWQLESASRIQSANKGKENVTSHEPSDNSAR